ncbi:response regulator transcription factor [Mucilaginibacter boryungensis]|uniref:Response regulator transcription factor n=1 Tax=Mucilaginibacter boryungensis TaxID=768480 RepID=A0ABR9XLN2_9SPHI|nr:response regulator transcription factor [Mucilaginibacter boryungensis]MBE9668126.1 response regulator transcription factor [Mucilaginibacter boryungensis]
MEQELTIRVAFADDHNLVRKGIISMLRSLGGIDIVIEADNGNELISKLTAADRLPEICILDISMPQMDGFAVLTEVKRRWPEMKVLVLTAFFWEIYIIRMMQAGANGYLLKECDIEEVKTALISIHNEGYYYSECANSTVFHLVNTKAIRLQTFTENEIEVLKYCCTDLTYGEIAQQMHTTLRSVEGSRDRIFHKLNLNSRIALVLFAIRSGLVTLDTNYYPGKTIIPFTKTK